MDASPRPEMVLTLPARHLGLRERVWRGALRVFGVTGIMLIVGNVLLIALPIPHVHLCIFPLAFILGPLVGFLAWRNRVVLAPTSLPCPRCRQAAQIPSELTGWPAHFNCEQCGIMVELNAA
jgi:hypothetical protein